MLKTAYSDRENEKHMTIGFKNIVSNLKIKLQT